VDTFRHGSLFSGIGGFDLAAEWIGWENVFHCEWNPFGQRILKYYWPNAKSYEDITKTDFTIWRGLIDVLSGGFPCQPYSVAGKRKGKEDDRHLWPEMLRAIREIQPAWVVGENVRGLTNWNGGLVFEEVQADLEAEGYEVIPVMVPACGVNAPHRRDRIWFIAYSAVHGHKRRGFEQGGRKAKTCEIKELKREWIRSNAWRISAEGTTTNAKCKGLEGPYIGLKESRNVAGFHRRNSWEKFPTVAPVCNGDDGLSAILDAITFPKWRNESIKAGGNAIVPQVAHQIFKAINEYEALNGAD